MGLYEFDKNDVYRFKNHIGGFVKEKGKELEFSVCPYCHGGSHKDRNTFSINLVTGQYECKRSSCGAKGNMITLARDFNFDLSEDVNRYFNQNDYNSKFRIFRKAHIEVNNKAVKYLSDRGISKAICEKYEVTVKDGTDNILVFPFFNDKDELKFIKYRKMDFDKAKDKSKEWCEADCMPILFGMKQCDVANKTLILTEGQIDSLSLSEAGIENAVSVPTGCNGFTWIPHCWNWINQFEKIIVFGDYENGKMSLLDTISKRFSNMQISHIRYEDYKDCKDGNEILQKYGHEYLKTITERAEIVPQKQIKRLADVEAVDILNTESISTGIKDIDNVLSGGFHLGQLILLTGKRGDGKSTFMSQLITEATEQNYTSFVYSGELVDFYFKRWIDMQIAGNNRLTNSTIDKINAWYHDKIYLYDNNIIDDEEMDDLLTVTENAICQYGAKFICIDNLMTALEVDSREDLYRAQSRFVGKLAKLAKIHNVVILLVAHPRKSYASELSNDDVSGSADITNKVDIVMSYTRIKDCPEDERKLIISKNRLTGKLTSDSNDIRLHYSDISKRIVGCDMDFSRQYSWNGNVEEFKVIEEEECPFK